MEIEMTKFGAETCSNILYRLKRKCKIEFVQWPYRKELIYAEYYSLIYNIRSNITMEKNN